MESSYLIYDSGSWSISDYLDVGDYYLVLNDMPLLNEYTLSCKNYADDDEYDYSVNAHFNKDVVRVHVLSEIFNHRLERNNELYDLYLPVGGRFAFDWSDYEFYKVDTTASTSIDVDLSNINNRIDSIDNNINWQLTSIWILIGVVLALNLKGLFNGIFGINEN